MKQGRFNNEQIVRILRVKLTPFHGHPIVLAEGVRNAQSQTALPGAIS